MLSSASPLGVSAPSFPIRSKPKTGVYRISQQSESVHLTLLLTAYAAHLLLWYTLRKISPMFMRVYPNYCCCVSKEIQYRKQGASLACLMAALDLENVGTMWD